VVSTEGQSTLPVVFDEDGTGWYNFHQNTKVATVDVTSRTIISDLREFLQTVKEHFSALIVCKKAFF